MNAVPFDLKNFFVSVALSLFVRPSALKQNNFYPKSFIYLEVRIENSQFSQCISPAPFAKEKKTSKIVVGVCCAKARAALWWFDEVMLEGKSLWWMGYVFDLNFP